MRTMQWLIMAEDHLLLQCQIHLTDSGDALNIWWRVNHGVLWKISRRPGVIYVCLQGTRNIHRLEAEVLHDSIPGGQSRQI